MWNWLTPDMNIRNLQPPEITPQNNDAGGLSQGASKARRVWRNMSRMFKAGKQSRTNSKWPSTPIPADVVVENYQRTLVARSREQCANNDYAKNYVRMVHQNVVGPQGVLLQAQIRNSTGKLDNKACEAVESAWSAWSKKHCDIRMKSTWRAIQRACVVSAVKDGEFFVRIIRGKDAGAWGFALQMIDAQRCPIDFHHSKTSSGGFIRQGIEFNQYGKPIAYYFSAMTGDQVNYRYGSSDFVRVDASEVIHGFLEDMVGQKRGLPWTATSLYRMHQLSEFEDSAIVNARVSANKMGFIQWRDGFGPTYDEDEDEIQIESEAGEVPVLPEGAEFKDWSPNYPTGEFLPFHKAMLRSMSAGMGVLYNNLASDLENVNFSSIRQGTLDEREHWKELQQWLIDSLIEPVFQHWLEYVLLKGMIKKNGVKSFNALDIERLSQVTWQPRRWAWIDPSSEVTAAEKSKNNMLTSPSAIIREQGKDPQMVWAEAARDVKNMIDEYVKQGISEEFAQEMVLNSMGKKQTGTQGRPKEGM
ncbi:MAG: phage portal protein [Pseudomonadota bacterium]|nr:phage portal protein [Pseudomonadota bacterium]